MGKTVSRKPKNFFGELNLKIREGLTDIPEKDRDFSQEGKALVSMFLCLAHQLHNSKHLDPRILTHSLLLTANDWADRGDFVAAELLRSVYVQLIVEFDCP